MMHVIPSNDILAHEESADCHCHPERLEKNGCVVMLHNSYDGRSRQKLMQSALNALDDPIVKALADEDKKGGGLFGEDEINYN